jgi:general secretion pathway protein M
MNDWFDNLDQKEQRIVMVAGSLIAVFLIWLVLIRPLFSAAATQARRVEIRKQELQTMQELAGRVIRNPQNPGAGQRPLVVIVNESAADFGLGAMRSQAMADGATLRITMDEAPFDAVVQWLGFLNSNYGVMVQSAGFNRSNTTGATRTTLVLARGL